MGLGLHGGGLVSAQFFAEHGAEVTVTDLRDAHTLLPSMDKLKTLGIKYVLGRHEASDFASADLVIKNPAVSPGSPYLEIAREVETDISIFLKIYRGKVIAITGTKGKSTSASAIHHVLKKRYRGAVLGGNITISPLSYLLGGNRLDGPAVLELSSWQLADLRGGEPLKANVALVTNIMRDHQNRYKSMQDYISDKEVICENQTSEDVLVLNYDDPVTRSFAEKSAASVRYFSRQRMPRGFFGSSLEDTGGSYHGPEGTYSLLPSTPMVRGDHNRMNLLAAGTCCLLFGVPAVDVKEGIESFPGIEHRLEYVQTINGVDFYNDSAATIPEATVEAVNSFQKPVVLVAGGTDKALEFNVLKTLKSKTKLIALLEGTGTDLIMLTLRSAKIPFIGPFPSLQKLIACIMELTESGDIILFSPGCTSFGMFRNEFDRGAIFKKIVQELA